MDGAVGVGVILLVSLRNLDIKFKSFLTPDLHTDFLMMCSLDQEQYSSLYYFSMFILHIQRDSESKLLSTSTYHIGKLAVT